MNTIQDTSYVQLTTFDVDKIGPYTNSNKAHPLETQELDTPDKVSKYFPQSLEAIKKLADSAISEVENEISSILSIPSTEKNFQKTFFIVDQHQALFHSKMQALWVVSMTNNDKTIRDEAKASRDRMKAFSIDVFLSNKKLFDAFAEAAENIRQCGENLSEQQQKHIEDTLKSMHREGLHLDENSIQYVKNLKIQINNIETTFLKNIDEDNSAIWMSKEELVGVPDIVLDALEKKGEGFKLTCKYPVYIPVMKYCQMERTRKALFHAYVNRAKDLNIPLLNSMMDLRHQLASYLGYATFADYDIEDQMARSPANVDHFLEELFKAAEPKAKSEIQALIENKPEYITLTENGKIKPWDISLLSDHYKKTKLDIDELELQKYFSFETTLTRLLELYSEFFSIEFEQVSNEGLWDPSTKMLAVRSKNDNTLFGHIILDLFPRPGKYGHGYCVDVLSPCRTSTGERKPAIATVIANLTPANEKTPSLLPHAEVETLFHEMGHALHELFGEAEMPTLSGYHTKIDFLELPSQLLEEVIWDPRNLQRIGEHYQTKEKIPEGLLQSKIRTKNSFEGFYTLSSIGSAKLSLELFRGKSNRTPHEIRQEIQNQIRSFMEFYKEDYMEISFRHLADPLYRSKYYCYDWAKIFAIDVYDHIQQELNEGKLDAWQSYRKAVLEPGGGKDPNEILLNLLGRAPSFEAYKKTLQCTSD